MTRTANANRVATPRGGLAGLDAYQVALEYYRAMLGALYGKTNSHVAGQAIKAAESICLNVAEAHLPGDNYTSPLTTITRPHERGARS